MIGNLSHYRLAVYLTSAIALIECIILLQMVLLGTGLAWGAIVRVILALLIVFGLWVQSKVIRYAGAVWLIFAAGSVIWPLVASKGLVLSFMLILLLIASVLDLVAAYLLLFSKTFSSEFARLRETQPKYKSTIRTVILIVIVIAAVAATLNDIYHLFLASSGDVVVA